MFWHCTRLFLLFFPPCLPSLGQCLCNFIVQVWNFGASSVGVQRGKMWKAIISRFLCLFHHFWKEAVLTGCFIFHLLSSNVFNFLIRNSLKGKRRNFLFFSRYELKVCPLSLSISLPGITGKLSVMKLERQRMCFFFRSSWKKSNSNHKNDKFFFSFSLHAQLSLLFIFFSVRCPFLP